MKKVINSTVIIFALLTIFETGCKKGEDDPFFSLRSRRARVVGDWKLISGTETDKSYDNSSATTYTNTNTYDGSTEAQSETISNSSGSFTTTNSISYTSTYKFEKDGTYTSTTVEDGVTITVEGTWNFGAGVGEKKNKSELVLTATKTVNDGNSYTYTGNAATEVYYIKELRNDKMVLVTDIKYTDSSGDTGEGISEMTYGQ